MGTFSKTARQARVNIAQESITHWFISRSHPQHRRPSRKRQKFPQFYVHTINLNHIQFC